MNDRYTQELNRLLGKLVFVLAIASAVILTPPILAGLELLGKG
jgi:hypothetical protein